MATKKEDIKNAEDMGYKARGIGLDLGDNAFGKNTLLAKAWNKGWIKRDKKKRSL